MRATCLLLVLLLTPLAAQPAGAQHQAAPPRQKIGLALGGGSARGLAHIGVLRWFEENHIPIDFIAGTSMGGLIGGAYASGMTPDQIQAVMRNADWDRMFLADSPYKYKTFRRKQDKREFPSLLEFGLRGGLTLPGGLNPGQQVALLLDRIALPYYGISSFDDLPTPYRCVATDLRGGEAVVLDKPPLARAMRATMAIPGVFTPVNWDAWLLVDGGALNNIPADVVRDMGADIVIAIDVGEEADEELRTLSLFSLLGRTIGAMMTTNSRRALASADLVLQPDLDGYASGSWRESDGLAERGFAAARGQAERLRQYAVAPAAHDAFQEARQARRRYALPRPTYIAVEGLGTTLAAETIDAVRTALAPALASPISPDDMETRLLTISGTDRYEYLTYSFTDSTTPTGLSIGVRPKSYGPPFLMLGLDLNNVDSTNFAFNLSTRVLHYGLVGRHSETRIDLVAGTEQRAAIEVLTPIARTGLFVAPRAYFDRRGRNLYVEDFFLAEYRVKRTGVALDLGFDIGRIAEVRGGVEVADVRGRRRIGTPGLPEAAGAERSFGIGVLIDTQTSPIVPTHGLRIQSSLRRYFAAPTPVVPSEILFQDEQYTVAQVTGSWFHTVREADRLFATGEAGTSFDGRPLLSPFAVGGPLRLGALNTDQVRGYHMLLGAGGYLRRISRMPDVLGGNILAGGWLETGSAYVAWDDREWKTDATFGLIVESLFGPVFAGASVPLQGGGVRFYMSLGPLFR